jgi:hypothetical protein
MILQEMFLVVAQGVDVSVSTNITHCITVMVSSCKQSSQHLFLMDNHQSIQVDLHKSPPKVLPITSLRCTGMNSVIGIREPQHLQNSIPYYFSLMRMYMATSLALRMNRKMTAFLVAPMTVTMVPTAWNFPWQRAPLILLHLLSWSSSFFINWFALLPVMGVFLLHSQTHGRAQLPSHQLSQT